MKFYLIKIKIKIKFLNKGNIFAPIMIIWFSSLFSIGIWRITLSPSILKAFNPYQAIIHLINEKQQGFYQIGKQQYFTFLFLN